MKLSQRLPHVVIALFLIGSVFFLVQQTGYAAGAVATLQLSGVTFNGCQGNQISGSFSVLALDSGGTVVNDTTPVDVTFNFSAPEGTPAPITAPVASGTIPFSVGFPAPLASVAELTLVLASDPSVSSLTYVFDCATLEVSVAGEGFASDGRMNLYMGDLIAALYFRGDAQAKSGLHVYAIQPDSSGLFIGLYGHSDFAPYLDNPPAKNVKIKSIGKTTLYALATGEFQVNIGPDAEGKITSVIFSDFSRRGVYSYVSKP